MENFPIFPIRKVPENVLKTLLWGPKTMRKKYWVVFEKFEKFLQKFSRKRGVSILAKFFEKENIPIFFRELLKNCGKTSWKGSETIRKNYLVVFKIWATKKKLTDHPSHPSIQALSRLVRSGWYPVAYMTRLEQSTCKTSHSMCKTRYSTCKTRQSKIFSKGKRKVFVNFIKEIPYKFVRPNF